MTAPHKLFTTPYDLLLDMQPGGNWVGKIGDISNGGAMAVDYVHVYSYIPEPASVTLNLRALTFLAACCRRP